jgi:hypothetical protein
LRSIESGGWATPSRQGGSSPTENHVETNIANSVDLVLGLQQSKCPNFTPEESEKNIRLKHPKIPLWGSYLWVKKRIPK